MNSDFAIILNFKLKNAKKVDTDFLVKTARNVGARAISSDNQAVDFQPACDKYTIALVKNQNGSDLTANDVIDTVVKSRFNARPTIINLTTTEDGDLTSADKQMLAVLNDWMHVFGHALNEGQPSSISASNDSCVLQNRHSAYQKYVFVSEPLPEQIIVSGIDQEPNRVEWIEQRIDLNFTYQDKQLTINLTKPATSFPWQVLRIQEHRPEDDILETKF
ncbi:hypothetical protein OZX56_08105 [Lactobacillus sp. ESL0684]|uniref:hypothetical protein n=1 Tax=Lactobacillus sp. ESL0684 TaxID=2983213 RepID=UPI0023F7E959|nr:hypothetical protein [Lactobacillus sp. ESL0684]WEV43454.1 hypothetical protein OZX56_08105 [Lactobacillus sp. ESL0684]